MSNDTILPLTPTPPLLHPGSPSLPFPYLPHSITSIASLSLNLIKSINKIKMVKVSNDRQEEASAAIS
jgi:hypothetical protein